jgi:polysaccharide transporter, PST family
MTTAAVHPTSKKMSVGDSFASGVMLMLVINIGQRVVGLVRNLGFCQFLSDAELGHWALANSFFVIAAPIAVLGLPGSFGKFAETYRIRQCLRSYFGRIATVCALSTSVLAVAMLANAPAFAWLVYGDAGTSIGHGTIRIVGWTALALLSQVGYNFIYDVALSLRQVRVISWMQMANGVTFTVLGIAWLTIANEWSVLLPSYAVACVLGMAIGAWCVWLMNHEEITQTAVVSHREMWPRILPFAAALWLTNLLSNSFELSDRYMLLHLSPGGEAIGQAAVGQYYCGRIIPNLLTSVALMLGGVLLPYLSSDWEAGRHQAIQNRVRQLISVVSFLFTGISIAAIAASPLLFEGLFEGRYADAQAILHLSLLQCTWASISMIAGTYLLCAERVHVGSGNLLLGLVANIGLNLPLIYYFGLPGSVIATAISNLLVMLLTFRSIGKYGCKVDRRALGLALLPAILLFGAATASCAITALFFIAGRTEWLLSKQDRADINAAVLPKLERFKIKLDSLWP